MNLGHIIKTGRLELWSKYRDRLREEHSLSYLFWECTLNCNFGCKHCGSSAGKGKIFKNELEGSEIKKVFTEIVKAYDARKITIAVTGGEPLLRPDLFEVMSYAHSLGFGWGMVTNGSLMTRKKVEQAKAAGMATVVVSIDGIGQVHDEFRGFPGAYEKAISAVKNLKEANFLEDLQITTSVHRKNIKSLEEMYQAFAPLGITSWRVMSVDPIGRARENKDILLDKEEFAILLDFIKQKRQSKSKVEVVFGCEGYLGLDYEGEVRPWLFNCNTGINTGSILANGDIFVCPNVERRPELIQGNIRKDDFVDKWENGFSLFRQKDRTLCAKCEKCGEFDYCLGGSFHLWDFDKDEPKMCHLEMLEQ